MSQVIIGDILPRTQLTAIASQTVFSTNWTANAESDVIVYQTPSGDEPDDAAQILSYPSQYSVSFIGDEEEVEITLVTPASAGDIITISRDTPADRENLYSNTNFTPSMLNNDFGILTLVDQQAQLVNQLIAPHYNYSANIIDIVDTVLPILSENECWVKNTDNTAFIPYALPASGIAPSNDTYILLTENPTDLPNAIGLDTLGAGILINAPGSNEILIRSITGTANQIDITNGSGVVGNIAIAISDNPIFTGTGGLAFPSGTTAQRPGVVYNGKTRYNTDTDFIEYYADGVWYELSNTGAVAPGSANDLAYYIGSGNSLGPLATANDGILATDSSGVPAIRNTVPLPVQSNITQLGTISSGVWSSTPVGSIYGGTGLNSYTLGDTLYASALNTLSALPGNITTAKQFFSQTGTGSASAAPVWSTIDGADITGAALTKVDDTNVTLTLGGTPSTALLRSASLTLGWTGSLSVARGGTGVTSVTSLPTITSWAGWDANKNLSATNFLSGYTTTATAASTTVLTVGSTYLQYFTGSTTQTVTMPVTSTLALGQAWSITNLSSGIVTIQSSGGNTILSLSANSSAIITCILTSGTTASSWDSVNSGVSTVTGSAEMVLVNGVAGVATIGPITLSLPQSIGTSSFPQFGYLGIGGAAVSGSAVNISGSFNIGIKTSNTVSNFASSGFWVNTTFTADNGISTGHISFLANENINVVTSIASAVSFEAHATILGGANITNVYGYFYAAPTVSGGTTATNAYGGFYQNPGSFATNKTALCAADMLIGFTAVSPATGGLCVSGSTSIGTSNPAASALLTLSSTTQGFLPTRMTTVQRDAIASAATGLALYNTTTSDLEFYNGSAWIGTSKSGVTTLSGTASQVLVNGTSGTPTSGAITLTLPQNINTSATFQVGTLSVGTSAITSVTLSIAQNSQFALKAETNLSSGNASNITSNLTYTQSSGTLNLYSFSATDYVTVSGSASVSNLVGYRVAMASNTGTTITTYRGFWGLALTTGAAANYTNAYTAYFANPDVTGNVISSNKTALYADDIVIGGTVSPPTNGLTVSGRSLFGTSTLPGGLSVSQVTLGGTTRSEMIFRASSGGTDMKTWSFGCNTGTTNNQFFGFTWNDAYTLTANWLVVQRNTSNYTIQLVNFPNGNTMFGSTSSALNKVDISGSLAVGSYAGTSTAPSNCLIISNSLGVGTDSPLNTIHAVGTGLFDLSASSGTVLTLKSGNDMVGDKEQGAQIKLTNSAASATTPDKYIRVDATGNFQILNAAYTTILSLSNSGKLTISSFQLTTSTTPGYVLTADGSANGTWQLPNATPLGLQSWTPAISFGGLSVGVTYTTQTGTYVVCGKLVVFAGYVLLSSKGVSVGSSKLTGLPVTSSSSANSPATFTILFTNLSGFGVQTCGTITNSVTAADLVDNNGGGTVTIDDTDFTNTTSMTFSGFYYID
jgi:hypothetical protein